MINATSLAIDKHEANGKVFNVGMGVPVTVMEVANMLVSNYGINVPVQVTGNYRLGDIRHNYADISRIGRLLGFKPSFSFSDGLKKFTEWVSQQPVKESRYEESIQEMKEKGLMK